MAYQNKIIFNRLTKQTIRFIQTSDDTMGELLEMETWYGPKSMEPAVHYHPKQRESFLVVSGSINVRINGKVTTYHTGDVFYIEPGTVHSVWNDSCEQTILNWKVQPALVTEYFLETIAGLVNDGKTDFYGLPDLLQQAITSREFSDVTRLAQRDSFLIKTIFKLLVPFAYLMRYKPFYKKYFTRDHSTQVF